MVETGHSLSLLCLVTLIRSRDQSPKHSHAVGTKYLSRKGELAKREHYKMHISHITIWKKGRASKERTLLKYTYLAYFNDQYPPLSFFLCPSPFSFCLSPSLPSPSQGCRNVFKCEGARSRDLKSRDRWSIRALVSAKLRCRTNIMGAKLAFINNFVFGRSVSGARKIFEILKVKVTNFRYLWGQIVLFQSTMKLSLMIGVNNFILDLETNWFWP